MLPWIMSKNVYGLIALVAVGAMIVTAPYIAGRRAERNKQAAEMAAINGPIVEQRGKDEAELDAEAKAAKTVDDAVKAALKKRFILDEETARLLGSVGAVK